MAFLAMPRERAPGQERRELILAAACRVATGHGLSQVSVRRVSAEAGLSVGSILFHFRSMDALLTDLLDWWLLRLSTPLRDPGDSMASTLTAEIERITGDSGSAELFFDFWSVGVHRPEIRHRIRGELGRYRETFRGLAAEALSGAQGPERAGAVGALAVALIQGYAVQATIDPDAVSRKDYLELGSALLLAIEGRLVLSAGET